MTNTELKDLEARLWQSADMLRAGAHLAANKYSQPILGLIFLRYAECVSSSIRKRLMRRITSARAHAWSVAIRR